MPKLSEFLFGKKGKAKQLSAVSPMQDELMKLIKEGLEGGSGAFSGLFGDFDQGAFDKGVTEPALKNFQERVLPMLQEKFIAGNQVGGSGMQNAQNKAAVDLQSELAALMYQAQQQQQQNKLSGIQNLLGKQTVENIYRPANTGAVQGLLEGVSRGAGQAASAAIAG